MVVFLDRERLEATLVEWPGASTVVVGVPTHGMRQRQPVQKVGQFTVLARPEDEVKMVGHQAVGQDSEGQLVFGLAEYPFKGGVVAVFVEERVARATPRLRTW
jgi:hypothetical protein